MRYDFMECFKYRMEIGLAPSYMDAIMRYHEGICSVMFRWILEFRYLLWAL